MSHHLRQGAKVCIHACNDCATSAADDARYVGRVG